MNMNIRLENSLALWKRKVGARQAYMRIFADDGGRELSVVYLKNRPLMRIIYKRFEAKEEEL